MVARIAIQPIAILGCLLSGTTQLLEVVHDWITLLLVCLKSLAAAPDYSFAEGIGQQQKVIEQTPIK